ncbi:MAG: hypothetical protein AAF940_05095 [Pseudomonadota bacterium]
MRKRKNFNFLRLGPLIFEGSSSRRFVKIFNILGFNDLSISDVKNQENIGVLKNVLLAKIKMIAPFSSAPISVKNADKRLNYRNKYAIHRGPLFINTPFEAARATKCAMRLGSVLKMSLK